MYSEVPQPITATRSPGCGSAAACCRRRPRPAASRRAGWRSRPPGGGRPAGRSARSPGSGSAVLRETVNYADQSRRDAQIRRLDRRRRGPPRCGHALRDRARSCVGSSDGRASSSGGPRPAGAEADVSRTLRFVGVAAAAALALTACGFGGGQGSGGGGEAAARQHPDLAARAVLLGRHQGPLGEDHQRLPGGQPGRPGRPGGAVLGQHQRRGPHQGAGQPGPGHPEHRRLLRLRPGRPALPGHRDRLPGDHRRPAALVRAERHARTAPSRRCR